MKTTSLGHRPACSMAGGRGHGVRRDSAAAVGLTLCNGCQGVLDVNAAREGLDTSVPCFRLASLACSGCSLGGTMPDRSPDDSESASVRLDRRATLRLKNASPAARHLLTPWQLSPSQLLYAAVKQDAMPEQEGREPSTRAADDIHGS